MATQLLELKRSDIGMEFFSTVWAGKHIFVGFNTLNNSIMYIEGVRDENGFVINEEDEEELCNIIINYLNINKK